MTISRATASTILHDSRWEPISGNGSIFVSEKTNVHIHIEWEGTRDDVTLEIKENSDPMIWLWHHDDLKPSDYNFELTKEGLNAAISKALELGAITPPSSK